MPAKENNLNRRKLLFTLGRTGAFCGLALIGKLAMSRSKSSPSELTCELVTPCRDCTIFENCSLPQALSFKQPSKERIHE